MVAACFQIGSGLLLGGLFLLRRSDRLNVKGLVFLIHTCWDGFIHGNLSREGTASCYWLLPHGYRPARVQEHTGTRTHGYT